MEIKDRRKYGLQLHVVDVDTMRLERLTPRNLEVARGMIETHKFLHPQGHYLYKILNYTEPQWEPILEEWRGA